MHEAMTRLPATPPTVGTPPGLDWHEPQRGLDRGRQLRAEAMAALLTRIGRAVGAAVRERLQRRADHFALMHMSDRMLADIGLRRLDVRGVVYGVLPIEQVTAQPAAMPKSADVAVLPPRPAAVEADRELDAAA